MNTIFYNLKVYSIYLVAFLFTPTLSNAQQATLGDYKILDTKKDKEISLAQLSKKLKNADVVFFGEEHNDSIGHLLEYELLDLMATRFEGVILSMEMFQSDVQIVLDEYLQDLITENNFKKDAKLWSNYKDYEKLVNYAKTHQIPILAANAPSRYTNRVTRNGLESLTPLSNAAKALLAPLPIDTLTGRYHEKFTELLGGHESMHHTKMYQSQNLWDATMAYRISQINTNQSKILHINGRFHSDEKLGTYKQLQKHAPELKLANISCFAVDDLAKPDWESLKHLADFIIITKQENTEAGHEK